MKNTIIAASAIPTTSDAMTEQVNNLILCCNDIAGEQDSDNNFLLIDTVNCLKYTIEQISELLPPNKSYLCELIYNAVKADILELDADMALVVYNAFFDGHGTESITDSDTWSYHYCDISVLYVNMGDTYVETLIFDVEERKLLYTTLGDFLEAKEREQAN